MSQFKPIDSILESVHRRAKLLRDLDPFSTPGSSWMAQTSSQGVYDQKYASIHALYEDEFNISFHWSRAVEYGWNTSELPRGRVMGYALEEDYIYEYEEESLDDTIVKSFNSFKLLGIKTPVLFNESQVKYTKEALLSSLPNDQTYMKPYEVHFDSSPHVKVYMELSPDRLFKVKTIQTSLYEWINYESEFSFESDKLDRNEILEDFEFVVNQLNLSNLDTVNSH